MKISPWITQSLGLIVAVIIGTMAGRFIMTLGAKPIDLIPVRGNYSGLLDFGSHEAVLFSSETCSYCKQAKHELQRLGADYINLDIDKSKSAAASWKALNAKGVPVLVTRRLMIIGFQPEAYKIELTDLHAQQQIIGR